MIKALDGTTPKGAYATVQEQAGTERTDALRSAALRTRATVDGSDGDSVSLSEEGRQKAAEAQGGGAGGVLAGQVAESVGDQSTIKAQIAKLREKIEEKKQELQKIQEDNSSDADMKQALMTRKLSEISILQAQIAQLQRMSGSS